MFPFERFVLFSTKQPSELKAILESSLAEQMRWSVRKPEEPFSGRVDLNGFDLKKVWGAQSGIVAIKGGFDADAAGTRITVTQRPTAFFSIFSVIWFGFAIVFTAAAFLGDLDNQPTNSFDALYAVFPFVFIGFGAYVFLKIFWGEASGTKYLLRLIFGATEITS